MPKTSNGCWLTPHNGTGHRDKRPVPKGVQSAFGKWFKVVYFNAEVSRAEAERKARVLAAQDDARMAQFRSLTAEQRARAIAKGGLPLLPLVNETLGVIQDAKARAAALKLSDFPPHARGEVAIYKDMMANEGADVQAYHDALAPVALVVEPAGEFSWDGLLDVLKRKQPPKDIASYERSLKLLREGTARDHGLPQGRAAAH